MAFDLRNFLLEKGSSFTWNDICYDIDRATVLHWPNTRIISLPQSGSDLMVTVNDDLFLAYVKNVVCSLKPPQSTSQQCQDSQELLVAMGYRVWTVREAVDTLTGSPEIEIAGELIACLERWFFIRKL